MSLCPETGNLEMRKFAAMEVADMPSKHKLEAAAPTNERDIYVHAYALQGTPAAAPHLKQPPALLTAQDLSPIVQQQQLMAKQEQEQAYDFQRWHSLPDS